MRFWKESRAVGSGQWAVGSGQWAVGSGQWAVKFALFKLHNGIQIIANFEPRILNLQLRIATTGSNFAACLAGIMPAKMPTTIQIITVAIINGTEINTGK
jgi:hypothetical protein